ncbi:MAG: ParA family protein [Planctomycetota bacterium]
MDGASKAQLPEVKTSWRAADAASRADTVRSIALANQKGGVGKTTTAIHLAHGLALQGATVALVDLDPQGNAVVALQGMEVEVQQATGGFRAVSPGLWILGASPEGGQAPDASFVASLRRRIEELDPDWLIADCPPRMDQWGKAGLELCDQVIVPVQAEFLAMHGLSQILGTLRAFEGRCSLLGVLPTMVDRNEQICQEVVANLRAHLQDSVFECVILRDAELVEAASHGESVFSYAPRSKAAFCYGELIREVCDGGSQAR